MPLPARLGQCDREPRANLREIVASIFGLNLTRVHLRPQARPFELVMLHHVASLIGLGNAQFDLAEEVEADGRSRKRPARRFGVVIKTRHLDTQRNSLSKLWLSQ